ncbi:MAG TPA: ATP-dependent metallopeptidase FtsH/Yme1/Tma family protein, partial [Thermodesulfovibrionales bacterium]|nr:ATP-dependent metallopeptidase FtsH/Yme1/Tma family protein [Thermodesulfovibrionales bacterium]
MSKREYPGMTDDRKDSTDKFKSAPWRIVFASLLLLVLLYMWSQIFNPRPSGQHEISYSQFMEQLGAANIKSVTIRKLQLVGEFTREVPLPAVEGKKVISAKHFITFLPAFQGEGLISKLQENKVIINVEPVHQESLV